MVAAVAVAIAAINIIATTAAAATTVAVVAVGDLYVVASTVLRRGIKFRYSVYKAISNNFSALFCLCNRRNSIFFFCINLERKNWKSVKKRITIRSRA